MSVPPGDYRVFVRTDERGRPCPDAWEMQQYFSQFGTVLDIYKPPNKSDMAFITYESLAELQSALENPKPDIGGNVLFLTQAQPRGSLPAAHHGARPVSHHGPLSSPPFFGSHNSGTAPALASGAPSTRVYVTGLTQGIDEDTLRAYFAFFGAVKDVYVPVDKATGTKKPFAFVTMTSVEETRSILSAPSHSLSDDVVVNVTTAAPREGSRAPIAAQAFGGAPPAATFHQEVAQHTAPPWGPARHQPQQLHQPQHLHQPQLGLEAPKQGVPGIFRLFVFGIPSGLNADMLRGHFARHGEILDIYAPVKSPDLAYITFSQEEELQDALVNSGVRIAGFSVQGIKQAQPREVKHVSKGGGKGGRFPY